ncbi:MAG TPA: UDP-N-acetylmuramate dehydrogenase [Geobacteraceae bacterium]|nr:UDP-N-acetylmuramate dehydrogenase [Geobacteraceae bacterium]
MEDSIHSLIKDRIRGEVLENEPLSRHTSLKVGGPADLFTLPADMADLRALVATLEETGIPRLVIGGGYNLLVRDGGFRGVVISLKKLDRLEQIGGDGILAEAGVANGTLVRFAKERGLSGVEFLIGIPGTIGGALSMNAGAQEEAILNRVESITTLREGDITVTGRDKLTYGYRSLSLAEGEIIVAATFHLTGGSESDIEERIESFLAHRQDAQRVAHHNAGSFFKNPEGKQAWRLIESAGLRGYRVGDAQVSDAHANFLVNLGRARASDFIELGRHIKEKVKEDCGITLEEEVRIVGEK